MTTVSNRPALAAVAREISLLADPTRLQILLALGAGERNVTDLCSLVGKRQAAVTHHLTILKFHEVASFERRGQFNFYRLTDVGHALLARSGVLI